MDAFIPFQAFCAENQAALDVCNNKLQWWHGIISNGKEKSVGQTQHGARTLQQYWFAAAQHFVDVQGEITQELSLHTSPAPSGCVQY